MTKLFCISALAVACAFGFAQDKKADCCAAEKMATIKAQTKVEKTDDCCASEKMATTKAQAKVNGKDACCKSTEAKPMAKGDKGCCNAKGESAKFKVYVAYEGYKFFGCEGSAKKGRDELVKQGYIVGNVQKVNSKVSM